MEIIYLLTINSVFFISYKLISSYFNKNVSEERIKWRERIRELTIEIVNTDKYEYKLIAELSTRLNLFDDNSDIEIIKSAEKVLAHNKHNKHKKEFVARISMLLKYDWERSKYESSINSLFRIGKPKQAHIDNFKEFYKANRNGKNTVFKGKDLKSNFELYKEEYKYNESCIIPTFFWINLIFPVLYILYKLVNCMIITKAY